MEWLSTAADSVGVLGAVFALFAWLQTRQLRRSLQQEEKRQNKTVAVVLQNGADRHQLPVKLRRSEFNRGEILGRIGMIPTKNPKERFKIGFTNTPDFLRQINEIIDGDDDAVLIIPCKEDELAQFDLTQQAY